MQPVNDNLLQQQVIPARQRINGPRETSPSSIKSTSPGIKSTLPEDVVTLSKDRISTLDPADQKKPSVPVTTMERIALQGSFSVYA